MPTWGIKFKHELAFSADAVLRLKYTRYLQSTVVEDGGHFAALEHPDILAADVFRAVEHFRLSRGGGWVTLVTLRRIGWYIHRAQLPEVPVPSLLAPSFIHLLISHYVLS